MYEVMDYYPKEIIIAFVVIMSACAVTYPFLRLIIDTLKEGVDKWKSVD